MNATLVSVVNINIAAIPWWLAAMVTIAYLLPNRDCKVNQQTPSLDLDTHSPWPCSCESYEFCQDTVTLDCSIAMLALSTLREIYLRIKGWFMLPQQMPKFQVGWWILCWETLIQQNPITIGIWYLLGHCELAFIESFSSSLETILMFLNLTEFH